MVPSVNMTVEADVTHLAQLRTTLNARRSKERHITISHIVSKAACDVLMDFPLLFASFNGKKVIVNPDLVLNVPVDIENHVEYLVIRRPNAKSLDEFAAESAAELARIQRGEGEFRRYVQSVMRAPAWIRRLMIRVPGRDIRFLRTRYGNFAISNFGSFGIDHGTVAISKPMIAAMCFGRIADRLIGTDHGGFDSIQILSLSITFDHRAVDGGYVGRYLSSLKQLLESADRLPGMPG
jgi:pyruvate dehydrogenase E2 component (dihydrolipoamide acetyltransferase)